MNMSTAELAQYTAALYRRAAEANRAAAARMRAAAVREFDTAGSYTIPRQMLRQADAIEAQAIRADQDAERLLARPR